MGEKSQIHVQVEADEKKRWEDTAEEHPEVGYGSLSRLIRMAVRKEIHRIENKDNNNNSDDTVTVDLSEIEQRQSETTTEVTKLRNSMESIDTKVEEVRRAVTADAKKRPLDDRLMEALPPAKPHSKGWKRAKNTDDPNAPGVQWATAWSGDIFEICKRVGESRETVETKLDEMGVPREEIDGETRYWMEGQL